MKRPLSNKRREYIREYQRKWMQERRKELMAMLGSKCAVCGSVDNLEFDHVNKNNKTLSIGQNLSSPKKVIPELQKCQLLCSDCHGRKSTFELSKAESPRSRWRRPDRRRASATKVPSGSPK